MAEFASKGTAGTALGLGIAGTALNLLNNNGQGLGGIFGGQQSNENAELRAQLAKVEAERYADGVGIATYKEMVATSNKADDKINSNYKELAQVVAEIKTNEAVTQSELKCLATNTNAKVDALRLETQSAIALESERRECGDKNLYNYVNATFVPGELKLPANKICGK